MLGKSVTDLQSDIVVGTNSITGTLKHVTGYTGFSGEASEQSGNYLALHFASDDADSITVELIGGASGLGEQTLDLDGILIARIVSGNERLCVRAYKDGLIGNVRTYNLSGLTLAGE